MIVIEDHTPRVRMVTLITANSIFYSVEIRLRFQWETKWSLTLCVGPGENPDAQVRAVLAQHREAEALGDTRSEMEVTS